LTKKKEHKNKFWGGALKIVLSLILVLILLAAGVLGYVNVKKNEISKNLITEVNTILIGEINVEHVEIESLWTYPNINVRLKNIEIFEKDFAFRDSSATPVIIAPHLLARVNLTKLFSSLLEIEFVEIKDATVVIERTEESEVTIGNTFMVAEKDTSNSDSILFVLMIDSIHLINTQVLLTDASLKDTLPLRVKELNGNLSFAGDEVKGFADAYGYFEKLDMSKEWSLTGKPLSFKVDYSVAIEEQKVYASSPELVLAKKPFQFDFVFDYANTSSFELEFSSLKEGIEISSAFNPDDTVVNEDLVYLKGRSHLSSKIKWTSNPKRSFLNNTSADIDIYGNDIHIMGVDIENYIDKYRRSQNFNLLDVGAVMFAGPAGLAVTKGSDYTFLLIKSKGDDSTVVDQFVSEWDLRNGRLIISDLAMSTERSRIASIGFYDLNKDSISFNILVLDKHGCALANQSVFGYTNDVQSGKVKVVKTLLGPVNNFFRNVGIAKCEKLYTGKVSHPLKKKKQKK
jgi:hypothetical protein